MPNSTKLQRYLLIIEKVQQQVSFNDLHAHLAAHGFELSPRTLQRDIEQIRVDLGVEVAYDREENSYRIVSQTNGAMVFGQLMERAQLIKLFQDQATVKELPDQLELDGDQALKGLRHIPVLLNAIRERRVVDLTYTKGKREKLKSVFPIRIKEYQGGWYVLGVTSIRRRPVSYCLNDINVILAGQNRIVADQVIEARNYFAQLIGVDPARSEVSKVKVRFMSDAAADIRNRPWHASQKEKTRKDNTTFTWKVHPNNDLVQRILSYGCNAQVLAPSTLAKEISKTLKAARKQYKK